MGLSKTEGKIHNALNAPSYREATTPETHVCTPSFFFLQSFTLKMFPFLSSIPPPPSFETLGIESKFFSY